MAGSERPRSRATATAGGGARRRTFTWEPPEGLAAVAGDISGLDFVQRMVDGRLSVPPVARCLGFAPVAVEPGLVVVEIDPEEFHYNPIGSLHGGVIATVCDSAMACAVQSVLPAGTGFTTLELKTNYVRAVTVGTGRLTCVGRTIQVGSRVATAEARLSDGDAHLVAHATTTCMILRPAAS